MANVGLTKPTQVPSGVVLKNTGTIGDAGSAIYIKLDSDDLDIWTPTEEVTGDGSTGPVWDNSEHLYMRFILRGWMVAGQTLGILNMKDQSSKITMGLNFGAAESFPDGADTVVHKVLIDRIRIRHRARAINVGVVVFGYTTDDPLNIDIG